MVSVDAFGYDEFICPFSLKVVQNSEQESELPSFFRKSDEKPAMTEENICGN
jgi:hypothetical protein